MENQRRQARMLAACAVYYFIIFIERISCVMAEVRYKKYRKCRALHRAQDSV